MNGKLANCLFFVLAEIIFSVSAFNAHCSFKISQNLHRWLFHRQGVMSCNRWERRTCRTMMRVTPENDIRNLPFDWANQWYPLCPLRDLDSRIPNPIRVLDMDLVVWYHAETSKWQVFQDRCPHRLAPLSEGRIDQNGNLQVSFFACHSEGCLFV